MANKRTRTFHIRRDRRKAKESDWQRPGRQKMNGKIHGHGCGIGNHLIVYSEPIKKRVKVKFKEDHKELQGLLKAKKIVPGPSTCPLLIAAGTDYFKMLDQLELLSHTE